MLAILDPELRRGAPSRKQTAGLVGGLAVLSLVVGAAVPVARAADASGRPGLASESKAKPAATDTLSFLDEEMAQSVRTVERKTIRERTETREQTSTRTAQTADTVSFGTAIGEIAGRAASAAVTATIPSIEALLRAPNAKQGRSDDRPQLLANVLKSDSSASLRRVAAWGLAQFADGDIAATALAGAVRDDKDASVREMAAWALSDARRSSTVIDALSTALRRDPSPKVRASAAWALGNIGDDKAVEALSAALSDSSRGVRMRAAWAIGNSEPKQAPKALVALLTDKEPEVRQLAAWALYNIQDPDAVSALDAAMQKETDRDTQRAFIRALASTGEKSVDAIKKLIDSKDPQVREAAIRALAGGGSSGPWPWPWPEPRPFP